MTEDFMEIYIDGELWFTIYGNGIKIVPNENKEDRIEVKI